jgi:predicted outer membrane repeat protein
VLIRRLVIVFGLAALTGTFAVGIVGAPAGAADFGPISDVATLRDVIENQATDPAGDTVVLAEGTTFTLTCASGAGIEHDPATPLTIIGNGSILEVEDGCTSTVFQHQNGTGLLHLEGFTIRGGTIVTGGDGAGVASATDTELVGMTFTDNHVEPGSSRGGALVVLGDATITDSLFTGNSSSGRGGAMDIDGALTMLRTTVSGNQAATSGGTGGGGMHLSGPSTVTDSTISGNSAGGDDGGGIAFDDTLTLVNSTVSGNTVSTFGGGVSGRDEGDALTLVYSTIAGNTGGDVANVAVGELTSFASVIALPQGGGTNCLGDNPITSFGYNVDDDDSCRFGDGPGDRPGFTGDLLLGPLADNGGPTQTLLPALTSPLVGAVPDAECQTDGASGITTDQRGEPRPAPGLVGCDVGAVEVQLPPEPIVLTPTFTG